MAQAHLTRIPLMYNDGPKNWGIVLFMLGSTSLLYIFLIFQHSNTARTNQELTNRIDNLLSQNEELHEEILRLNIKLAKLRGTD